MKALFFAFSLLVVLAWGFIRCCPLVNFSRPSLPSWSQGKLCKMTAHFMLWRIKLLPHYQSPKQWLQFCWWHQHKTNSSSSETSTCQLWRWPDCVVKVVYKGVEWGGGTDNKILNQFSGIWLDQFSYCSSSWGKELKIAQKTCSCQVISLSRCHCPAFLIAHLEPPCRLSFCSCWFAIWRASLPSENPK